MRNSDDYIAERAHYSYKRDPGKECNFTTVP